MAKKLPSSINLLDPVNAPDDIWDQLYYWVFNVGKYLFVFVELIVLLVFASRFFIDKRNNDLTRDINQLVEDLSGDYYRQIDAKYNNLHELLEDLRYSSENQVINSKVIASVLDSLPTNIELQNFSFSNDYVSMVFVASDFESIRNFERLLDNNPAYEEIQVSLVKTGELSSKIDFTVSFSINKENLEEEVEPEGDSNNNRKEEGELTVDELEETF